MVSFFRPKALVVSVALMTAMIASFITTMQTNVSAGNECCKCGCEEEVKYVYRLVRTYKKVVIPNYKCAPITVFQPHKGKVPVTQYRCDTYCELHKNCDCTYDCCCTTESGCKTLYGAKPTGCHCEQCVRQPIGQCTPKVAVYKWVKVPVCKDCCSKA
ncbi:MAG: hypothetical protein ACI9G1_004545, partial [Pirellulaceae bacterium]